jgi:hypothetical protein
MIVWPKEKMLESMSERAAMAADRVSQRNQNDGVRNIASLRG